MEAEQVKQSRYFRFPSWNTIIQKKTPKKEREMPHIYTPESCVDKKRERTTSHRSPLHFLLHRSQVVRPYRVRFEHLPQRRTFLLVLLLQMIHSQRGRVRTRQLIRFSPKRLTADGGACPSLHIVIESIEVESPRESFGPGGVLRRAAAAAAGGFGADVGGGEGNFAEEGLQDGEAAAGDGKVDFDGPVCDFESDLVGMNGEKVEALGIMQAYIQIVVVTVCQAGSVAYGKVYSMYCLTMAIAQILLWVSGL